MRQVHLVALLACALVVLGGCGALFGPPTMDFTGPPLQVNADGHFLEEVTYTEWDETATFRPDGSFTWTEESYEHPTADYDNDGVAGEGWVTDGGSQGTYSYDSENYELTATTTKTYENGAWQEPADGPTTRAACAYFAEHYYSMREVYVADEARTGAFVRMTESSGPSGSDASTVELSFHEERRTWTRSVSRSEFGSDGTRTLGWQSESEGTFVVFPEGTAIASGNAGTVHLTDTAGHARQYDTMTETWKAWQDSDYRGIEVYNIAHMGDFLIVSEEGPVSTRSAW
jgi:hypothetical protein